MTRFRPVRPARMAGQALVLVAVALGLVTVLVSILGSAMIHRHSAFVRYAWEEKAIQLARGAVERYIMYLTRGELWNAPPDVFVGFREGIWYVVFSYPASGNTTVVSCRSWSTTPAGYVQREIDVVLARKTFEILSWEER